jgi:hypothetical protein
MQFNRLCEMVLSEMAERDGEHVTVFTGKNIESIDSTPDEAFIKTFVKNATVRLPIDRDVVRNIITHLSQELPKPESATSEHVSEFSKSNVVDKINSYLKEIPSIARIIKMAPNYQAADARLTAATLKILAYLKKKDIIQYPKLSQLGDAKVKEKLPKDMNMGRRNRGPSEPKQTEMEQYQAILPGSVLNLNQIKDEDLNRIHKGVTKRVASKIATLLLSKTKLGIDTEGVLSIMTPLLMNPVQSLSFREYRASEIRNSVAKPLLELLISAGVLEQETRERPIPKKDQSKTFDPTSVISKSEDDIKRDIIANTQFGGFDPALQTRRDYEG